MNDLPPLPQPHTYVHNCTSYLHNVLMKALGSPCSGADHARVSCNAAAAEIRELGHDRQYFSICTLIDDVPIHQRVLEILELSRRPRSRARRVRRDRSKVVHVEAGGRSACLFVADHHARGSAVWYRSVCVCVTEREPMRDVVSYHTRNVVT